MRYSTMVVLGCLASVSGAAVAGPAVTVYNQDFAVVKSTHRFAIPAGESTLTLTDVAEKIDPTSVQFRCPDDASCRIVEQNFDFDLVSTAKLMAKMIDRRVEVVTADGKAYAGKLLSFEGNRATLLDGGLKIIELDENVRSINLPEKPEELLLKPALVWQVARDSDGAVEAEVAYQTAGMTWRADYNVSLTPGSGTLDVNAWVTLTNESGARYDDATLKVVAGDVHKVEEEQDLMRNRIMAEKMVRLAAGSAPAGFEERQFSEYHLYALGRPTSIAENQTKQIEMFTASGVPYRTVYELRSGGDRPRGPSAERFGRDGEPMSVVLIVDNKKENELGIPLPAGRVRMYQADAQGAEHLVGTDSIDHTPKDEEVRLTVGESFDVLAERTQTQREKVGEHTFIEAYRIRVRNHKDRAVTAGVIEQLYGGLNWTIENNNMDFARKDFRTIEFRVKIEPNSEKTIVYQVRYERYEW